MAFRGNHVNKKTGVTYVYESTSYWDQERKQSWNKQVYIGKIDPGTGKFVPAKRLSSQQAATRDPAVTATAQVIDPAVILSEFAQHLGLRKLLNSCFPDMHSQILTMAYYLACRKGALCHCEALYRLTLYCKAMPNRILIDREIPK